MNAQAYVAAALLLAVTSELSGQSRPREWVIESRDNSFGIILSATSCGDIVYLGDTQQKIHRYNLTTNRVVSPLGGDNVAFPTSLAADCSGRVLYNVTGIPLGKNSTAAVQAIDMDSGELKREYQLPRFLPRPGTVFQSPESLLISGLWIPREQDPTALLHEAPDSYYKSLRLGLKLSLKTGDAEPMLAPYETGCIGGGQCPNVRTNAYGTTQIASLPASLSVGVYETGAPSPRVVSIRSQQFVRDGEVLPIFVSIDQRMRWLGRNSTIYEIYAFKSGFAAIHARPLIHSDYQVGQRTAYTVYMNAYQWDGTPIAIDVLLPDLPIGQSETGVYVIDYGPDLRREGARSLRLVEIPVVFSQ